LDSAYFLFMVYSFCRVNLFSSRYLYYAESLLFSLGRFSRFYVKMQLRLQHSESTDGEPGKHKIRRSNDPASEHEFE